MKIRYRVLVWWWSWSLAQRGVVLGLVVSYLILLAVMLWFAGETKHWKTRAQVLEVQRALSKIGPQK